MTFPVGTVMKTTLLAVAVTVGLVAGPGITASPAALPAGCTSGSAASAAARLVHPAAEVTDRSTVAGFDSALVLEPVVYPGVRHRLIRAGDLWCDSAGFNAAWELAGRSGSAVAMASAYVQLVAAPYFDGVTVMRAREVTPGIVALDTHARTNGIAASWTVAVDGSGVRHATWTATGFAVKPFMAEWEGVTASPGVTRTYARSADGSLLPLEPVLPGPGDPELVTEGKTADGFTIRVDFGESGYSPNLGQDTGVHPVDYLRFVRKVTLDNYQDFYDWGFRKDWSSDVGIVYVDSSSASTCFACVYYSQDFNIHISSAIVQILFALGFEYPDDKQAFASVIGHEMTHNWQNAYYKPSDGRRADVAWSEGIARFQESLHTYSGVSHQPKSLIYSLGRAPGLEINSCNGWGGPDMEATFAAGPFTDKWYNACYFHLSWYLNHGTSGIVDWFVAMKDHAAKVGSAEIIDSLEQASPGTFSEDLAAFAQASLTGRGYTWPAPGTTEPARDWGLYLQRFTPPTLALGEPFTKTLRDGGVMARQLNQGGELTMSSDRVGVDVYVVRDDGAAATRAWVDTGDEEPDQVAAPTDGESVWVVAVYPYLGRANVTLRVS